MKRLFVTMEALLRGAIDARALASGATPGGMGRVLLLVVIACGAFYGICTGLYGVMRAPGYSTAHVLGVMLKVPLLFLLTLVVTAPSMYVFVALARSELKFRQTARLLLASSALSTVALASFGPVTVFFTCGTDSHPFMQLLNVVFFAIAGLIGVSYLERNLGDEPNGKGESRERSTVTIVRLWFVIYAAVGMQMGWLLRPFIGSPGEPAVFLRETGGDVLRGILDALQYL